MKELVELRSASTKRFQMSDGSVEAELYAGPVHYRDKSGTWQDIDTRVGVSDQPDFALGNAKNAFDSRFGRRSDRLVRFEADGRWVSMGIAGAGRAVRPSAAGSTVTFPDVFGAADVRYHVGPQSLKEEIVLDAAPATASYTFSLRMGGVRAQAEPDGSIGFYRNDDSTARPVFVMPKPFMTDSAPDASSPYGKVWSDKVTQTVTQKGGEFEITVSADRGWLAAEERVWPVVIDPTIELVPDPAAGQDAMIIETAPTSAFGSSWNLNVGNAAAGANSYRSLLKFDLAALGIPSGTKVKTASLDVHYSQPHTNESGDVAVEARKVTKDWTESTATWNDLNTSYFTGSLTHNLIQVDDEDELRVQLAGPWEYWKDYTNSLNGGLSYLPTGTTPDTFTWSPNISDPGEYRVDAYYTALSNRGTPTYSVTDDTGTPKSYSVNQTSGTSGAGIWATLGTQPFTPGKPASITMTRGATSSSPVADAVRLVEAAYVIKKATQRDVWHSYAAGNVVQEWVTNPSTNFGIMLKAASETTGSGGPSYEASENSFGGETANRPRLVIQYDEPSVDLAAPVKINPTGAELSWGDYVDPSPGDGDDLVEFEVYRGCVSLPDAGCTNPAPVYFDDAGPGQAELLATIPKDVRTFVDTTASASGSTGVATYRYWVIARTKDGTRSPSESQLVQTPRPGRVMWILTGDISDTTIANATAYKATNIPSPDGYNRLMPGNNHTTYGDTRALMEFDTASIPEGATVLDSELQLWKSTAPGTGATYDLHELTRDFVENQATWNDATSTIKWTTEGGDFTPAALASLTATGSPTRMTFKGNAQTDKPDMLTEAVQRWANKFADNHGLLIKARDETVAQQRIALGAGEFSEPALRPKLIVEYLEKTTTGTYYAPEIPDRVVPNTTLTVPVTVTNPTRTTWTGLSLSYRWMVDGKDATTEGARLSTAVNTLEPGESHVVKDMQIRVPINSQTGNKRQTYTLELELRDANKVWMSALLGIDPVRQPVIVEDPASSELGLEKFFTYSGEDTGSGSSVVANLHSGNVVFGYDPIRNPSRGASTFVRLTYNSMDGTTSPAGYAWSVQASTLTRLGDALTFNSSAPGGYPLDATLIDGDGTSHTFTLKDAATGMYDRPAGVALELRHDKTAAVDRQWVFTRPDGTRFYFEQTATVGHQTYVRDRNGNETKFTYTTLNGNRLLTSITDPDPRQTLTLGYEANGQLRWIKDISDRGLRFHYTDTEQLSQLVDGGGYNPATDSFADPTKTKTFTFGYTTDSVNGNSKLTSVTDPRNGTTTLQYYASTTDSASALKLQKLTDRRGKVTEFAYADTGGIENPAFDTTVTGVLGAQRLPTVYTMDAYGRTTSVKNANGQTTHLGWDKDNNVIRMQEEDGAVSTWVYDPDTGYPTSIRDAEATKNNTPATTLKYATMPGGVVGTIPTAPVRVLTEKVSPEGNRWLFGYDVFGNLKSVTDPLGVATSTAGDYETTYDYNTFGQLTAVHDANGNPPTVYGDFDKNGYPQTITDPLGKATTFLYDERGQVVSITDALGKITTAEYDAFGRPTKQSTPLDSAASTPLIQTTQTHYDLNDNVTSVIAPNGAETTATYSAMDQQESSILPSNGSTGTRKVTYTYDDLGRLLDQTAPQGNLTTTDPDDFVTRYSYDPIGQLTDTVTPLNATTSYKTSYRYDDVGNLERVIDARKNETASDTDFTTKMSYDLNHRVIATTDAAGYANRTQYDRDGRATAKFDADGNKQAIVYDARGKVTQVSVPHTPTGAKTVQRTTRFFYDQNGNKTKTEQPRGVATTTVASDFLEELVYDANNRVIQRKSPFDVNDTTYKTPASTFYEYDAVGNLSRQAEPTSATTKTAARDWSSFTWYDNGLAKSSTDPWGISTSYGYNLLGLQTTRTLSSAAGDATRSMSWAFWDDGSLMSRSDTAPQAGLDEVLVDNSDLQNTVVTGTWATGTAAATKVGYDYRTHAGASGSTDSFGWKLRIPSTGTYQVFARCPQGAGTATAAVYSIEHSTGTTAKTINQAACAAESPWVSLGSYTFTEGVDKKVKLAVPATGTVVADAVKLVKAGNAPGAVKDFAYGYDPNGQLTSIQDKTTNAPVDTYEVRYDGLGRADRVRELKAGVARATTTYGYDANSNLTSWFADDQAAPETDQYAAYSYDVRDLLESVQTGTSPTDTGLKETKYTYTSRGQRAGEVKPNGNKVAYRYLEDGLLRSQTEYQGPTLISSHSLAYNLDGHRTSDVAKVQNADSPATYLNQTSAITYTPDNRLRWVTKTGAQAGGNEAYAYDPAGNVTARTMAGVSTVYSFDRNRLLQATSGGAATDYNYDPFGRLDTVTAGDKLVERYGYDGFDRTVSHKKYDPATGASKSTQTSVFDPLDRTVSETTQVGTQTAKTKTFTHLGLSEQVVSEEELPEGGGAAKSVASYTYGPGGERISQTKTPLAGGAAETSYYGLNPHTDVETLTSETGDVRSTYRYTGYGENDAAGFTGKDKATATGGPEVEAYNPYRFNSKRWDPATGGYDMGFRDYSPGLNRFLTRDMYNGALADLRLGGDPWTENRYAFAGGNPITGIEYDGHCPIDACGVGTPLGDGRVADFGPVDPGNDAAGYVRGGVKYDPVKPQGEYRQTVGVRQVVAPNTTTYTAAMSAAQQQMSARGAAWAQATNKYSGCTSMDTVIDAQGSTCDGAGLMHATELAALMCQQPGMTCGDNPGTLQQMIAMGAAGGMMFGGKDGGAKGAANLPSPRQAMQLLKGAKPVGSALKSDSWHRSGSFVIDDVAKQGTVFRTTGGDGVQRLLIQMPGEVNGAAGRFEWILDGGNLTHQMFVRGGTINGIPIKR